MRYFNSILRTAILFFISAISFVIYFFFLRWNIQLPIIIFWTNIILMISITTHQILTYESLNTTSSQHSKLILFEILVINIILHLIYQIPNFGLLGSDAYGDYASAKSILTSGFIMGDPEYITTYSYFPIIHILGVIFSFISGIVLFNVAKWLPSFISVAVILFLYLFILNIYKKNKIALLTALLFSFIQHQTIFSSLYIRETIGLVIMVCCLYLYYSSETSPRPIINYILSILCLLLTIISHHLTSFMLVFFFSINYLLNKMSKITYLRNIYFGHNIRGREIATSFLLIGFVSMLIYWQYVIMFPLITVASFIRNTFFPAEGIVAYSETTGISVASIRTLRGIIIFYGFFFFHFLFSLIILYKIMYKDRSRKVETYSFILFFFINAFMGFVSLYFVPTGIFPDRYLMYGWLFGSTPLVISSIYNKNKWFNRIGTLLLVAFMLFNIYMIGPGTWNLNYESISTVTTEEDYALANTLDFSDERFYGPQNSLMAIYDVQKNKGTIFRISEVDLNRFDWLIIHKRAIELENKFFNKPRTDTIAILDYLMSGHSTDYIRIYESDNLLVLKSR